MFEIRDPSLTSAGFYPSSDTDSGGASDPLFERFHSLLPKLDEYDECTSSSRPPRMIGWIVAAIAATLICVLLFKPDLIGAIVAR